MPFQIHRIQFFLDGRTNGPITPVAVSLPSYSAAVIRLGEIRNEVAQLEIAPTRAVPKLTTEVIENMFEVRFSMSPTDGTWRRYFIKEVE